MEGLKGTFLEKRLMRWTMVMIYVARVNQILCIVLLLQSPVKPVH